MRAQAQRLYLRFVNGKPEECADWVDDAWRIFSRYPREIVEQCCDPATGIAVHREFVPKPYHLRGFCDKLYAPTLAAQEFERRSRVQQEQARDWLAPRPPLSAKMLGWLDDVRNGSLLGKDDRSPDRRRVAAAERDQRFFERECLAAGMPADSPCSPSLVKILKEREWGGGKDDE